MGKILAGVGAVQAIDAFVTFAATFLGVGLSLFFERRSATAAAKEQAGRILLGVQAECAGLRSQLSNIEATARLGSTSAVDLRSDAMTLALTNPAVSRWGDYSLLEAIHVAVQSVGILGNILSVQRAASIHGGGISLHGVEDLKIRCRATTDRIKLLEELVDAATKRLGVSMSSAGDPADVHNRIATINRAEDAALARLQ